MNLTITEHIDILDSRESMRKPLFGAIALHAGRGGDTGDLELGKQNRVIRGDRCGRRSGLRPGRKYIPIQHHGAHNPVANDSQSEVPQTPAKQVDRVKQEKPKPDAVAIKTREPKKKLAPIASEHQMYRNYKELTDNQATAKQAPQVSNPMFQAQQGSGNVGVGTHTTLGTRFGVAYGSQVQQIVASNWHTSDVDAKYQNAPVVIATFDISRDGTIENLAIFQGSGIQSLDFSGPAGDSRCESSPPLPQAFDKNHATVEFWFELKR